MFLLYAEQFGLTDHDFMDERNLEVSETGQFHSKFVQYHKGYPVEGAMLNVIGEKDLVLRVNGFVLKGLDLDVEGVIAEDEAISTAIEFIGANTYAWEDSLMEAEIKGAEGELPNATYLGV